MDRRTSLQWMLAAAALPAWGGAHAAPAQAAAAPKLSKSGVGYGTDPDLVRSYPLGELWPLTFTAAQQATAAALCRVIIPADASSPSAADVGVPAFIDEWVSAPYPAHVKDCALITGGLAWIEQESTRRFAKAFTAITESQQAAICDDICFVPRAQPAFTEAANFFARFRDLTAGGFYTTPQGTQDLGFVGNVPSTTFAGPPEAALKLAGVI